MLYFCLYSVKFQDVNLNTLPKQLILIKNFNLDEKIEIIPLCANDFTNVMLKLISKLFNYHKTPEIIDSLLKFCVVMLLIFITFIQTLASHGTLAEKILIECGAFEFCLDIYVGKYKKKPIACVFNLLIDLKIVD